MTSGQRGHNITLILAISPQLGVVHYQFHDGGVNAEVFSAFIVTLSGKLSERECIFVYDNAPCHNCEPETAECHVLKKLPPWSPMLNPIEEIFSVWKGEIKGRLADHNIRQELLDFGQDRQTTLAEWRKNILLREGEKALETVTAEKCMQMYNHSFHFLYKCLTDADL